MIRAWLYMGALFVVVLGYVYLTQGVGNVDNLCLGVCIA